MKNDLPVVFIYFAKNRYVVKKMNIANDVYKNDKNNCISDSTSLRLSSYWVSFADQTKITNARLLIRSYLRRSLIFVYKTKGHRGWCWTKTTQQYQNTEILQSDINGRARVNGHGDHDFTVRHKQLFFLQNVKHQNDDYIKSVLRFLSDGM
jgi:hypothetical protein